MPVQAATTLGDVILGPTSSLSMTLASRARPRQCRVEIDASMLGDPSA
jgi:hypothetical protein